MKEILSVYIPTLNEEINLPQCLSSVSKLGATVFVVDSNSTDKTVEIARAAGCQVVTGNWRTFADKMNWAISELPIQTPWMLRIDADEWLTDELIEEIKDKLHRTSEEIGAYSINRRVYFLNHWIRFGGMYPLWSVRLWRTGKARCEVRELDEHMEIVGRIEKLKHDIVDESQRGLVHWTQKHNQYADAEVREIMRDQRKDGVSNSLTAQAFRKRWLKANFYYRLPKFIRPFLLWIYQYFLQLGFLDGIPGLVYHTLHGLWYRFLVDAKLYELGVHPRNVASLSLEKQKSIQSEMHDLDPSLPKVAILLCTYHGKKFLTGQLNSFEAQSHKNWELWASDDGSKDDTQSILEAYKRKWGADRLTIIFGPEKGYAANFISLTCNPSIRADYFAYSDQDDIWNANKLENAVNWLKTIPQDVPAFYCTRTCLIDSQNNNIGYSPLRSGKPSFANALIQSLAGGNTIVFNNAARQLVMQAGQNVNVVSHDWWLYILVTGCGGKVYYDPNSSMLYRQHSTNLVGMDKSWIARLDRILRVFNNFHKYRNELNISAALKINFMFTPENQKTLEQFAAARSQWFLPRLFSVKKSGVYCQTFYGNVGLLVATIFKKI